MARTHDDSKPDANGGGLRVPGPGLPDPEDDFTSELSDELLQAVGAGAATGGRADLSIGSIDAAAYSRIVADELLPEGFVLNDRYEIVSLVHSGGMGHVYKAVDHKGSAVNEDDYVAIKMLRTTVAAGTAAGDVLAREAEKVQSLTHPNVIEVFDFDQHDGHFFLVMEWLDGESLNAFLKRTGSQQLDPELVWPFIEGTAAALEYAHSHNIVHADVNPSNIFLTREGRVKLLDFGVSRDDGDEGSATGGRLAWVTQSYSSPEVLSGKPPVMADDIFSLGCVAYRLLAGRHPFNGSPSLLAQNQGFAIQPVAGLAEPEWAALRAALAYARENRPATVGVFRRGGTEPGKSGAAPGKHHSRRVGGWLAAAVVAAIVVAAFFPWRNPGQPDAGPTEATAPIVETAVQPETPQATLQRLLDTADEAFKNGLLVDAEDAAADARALYREALALEPGNATALRGLRSISDSYVQRASEALDAGDPVEATANLAVAAETDPDNPAIAFVAALLVAQGDRLLADARLAAAEGDSARAVTLLATLEPFDHIDPADITEIRNTLAAEARDALFLQRLQTADAHMAAGRLTQPEDQNALDLLVDLYRERPTDLRLLGSMERLGQRLLTRAGFSTAAGRFAEAAVLLDSVDRLGVLAAEADAARAALQVAVDAAVPEPILAEDTGVPGQPAADDTAALPAVAADDVATSPAPAPDAVPNDVSTESAGAPVEQSAAEPRTRSLNELGIERYVAPSFPLGARRRGLEGFVDVAFDINPDGSTGGFDVIASEPGEIFADSAVDAVRQWRFAAREDEVRATVRLRFETAP